MAPRKKAESTEVAAIPLTGELIPNMNLDVAVGRLITTSSSGIPELESKHTELVKIPDLVAYAGTIDGNADLKAYVKACASLRSRLDSAHKDAKAPFWDACKSLDTKLKELKAGVELLESPAKTALADYANQQARLAAEAQATRLAELEAENAKLKAKMVEENVMPLFADKRVTVVIRGREISQAARALFGDAYDEVKTDENGVNYVLEVVLQRKEIQDA